MVILARKKWKKGVLFSIHSMFLRHWVSRLVEHKRSVQQGFKDMFNLSQGLPKPVSVYMQAVHETLHDLVVQFFKFEK